MSLYTTILFLHIASAIGFFIGNGLEWAVSTLLRKASSVEQVRAWLRVYRVSPPLSGASLVVLILSGGYLASVINAMKQGWMSASLVAIVIGFSLGFAINLPRIRAIRDSVASVEGPLPGSVRTKLQNAALATSVRTRTMLAIGIVYLMTTKPPLGTSFLALGVAAVIGLLLSIRTWSRSSNSETT